jgi:mannose-6-phosphate isomerase-like protein (cupin superfamily)
VIAPGADRLAGLSQAFAGETTMRDQVINLRDKLGRITEHWSPRVVAEMNDYQFKLVKLQGEFVWHAHADTDEVFLVLDGALVLELRDRQVALAAGEMYVVPKGVEHRPIAADECCVLLVEPRGVVNTGDAGGTFTAPNDVWI